jgi:hypothetical protein
MIVVAAVDATLGVERMRRRRAEYLMQARIQAHAEAF